MPLNSISKQINGKPNKIACLFCTFSILSIILTSNRGFIIIGWFGMRYLMWEWDRVSFFFNFPADKYSPAPTSNPRAHVFEQDIKHWAVIYHSSSIIQEKRGFRNLQMLLFFLARSITLPLTIFSPIQVKAQLSFATERSSFSSLVTTEIRLSWFKRPCYMKHVSCQSTKTQVWNKWAAQLFLSKPSFVFLLWLCCKIIVTDVLTIELEQLLSFACRSLLF